MSKFDSAELPRRDLLRDGLTLLGGAGVVGLAACSAPRASVAGEPQAPSTPDLVTPGARILFQGDSITDATRDRNLEHEVNMQAALGWGYAWMAASGLLATRPGDELQIENRGISGNKVYELAERWDADCLALEPDLLSILIGVNDYNHHREGNYDGTLEVYERDYDALLTRTREALPDVRLVVCEPFLLEAGPTQAAFVEEFGAYRAAARRVATAHGARWVPFQSAFDAALQYAPAAHWLPDGVHATEFGAALMAQTWRQAVEG